MAALVFDGGGLLRAVSRTAVSCSFFFVSNSLITVAFSGDICPSPFLTPLPNLEELLGGPLEAFGGPLEELLEAFGELLGGPLEELLEVFGLDPCATTPSLDSITLNLEGLGPTPFLELELLNGGVVAVFTGCSVPSTNIFDIPLSNPHN